MRRSMLVLVLINVILCSNPSLAAPRSKSRSRDKPSSTTYDQKQTGEYNIQLHLKDFQIIAVVGEDSLGIGDYDYNYDYAEFTIKPQGANLTTAKPTDFESVSILANLTSSQQTNENTTQSTTRKPLMHQHFQTTTKKPNKTTIKTAIPITTKFPSTTIKVPAQTSEDTSIGANDKPITTPVASSSTTTTAKSIPLDISSSSNHSNASTDKIPVVIHDDHFNPNEAIGEFSMNFRKHDEFIVKSATNNELIQRPSHVTNVAIMPADNLGGVFEDDPEPSDQLTLGEIMQYRRCAVGYARDKRGRCRKIRRPTNQTPQLPLGITRFASNLAARFRQATSSPVDTLMNLAEDYNTSESNGSSVVADVTH